jgi:hypothetical protein
MALITSLKDSMMHITEDTFTIGLYINALKQCCERGMESSLGGIRIGINQLSDKSNKGVTSERASVKITKCLLEWQSHNSPIKRKIVIASIAGVLILLGWLVLANIFTDERVAINKAKERIEKEVLNNGVSLASINNVKAQLVRKEDKDLKQRGRYLVTGGVEFNPPGEQKSGYRLFRVYVDFYDNNFQASSPTYESDYSKK